LSELHSRLGARGLRILAFPCNQFGQQEPGSAADIRAFADSHGARFDFFEKVKVNGRHTHPVYAFLKGRLSDVLGASIKWNFTKFLVGRDGVPVARYSPPTAPLSLEADTLRLLDAPAPAPPSATAA